MQLATYHATSAVWAEGPGRPGAGPQDDAGHGRASPPGPPASVVVQMQHVFHELHANGRNALCAVCDGQYGGPGTAS